MRSLLLAAMNSLPGDQGRGQWRGVFNLRDSCKALFVAMAVLTDRTSGHILVAGSEDEAESLLKDLSFFQTILDGRRRCPRPLFLPEQGGVESTCTRLKNILDFRRGGLLVGSAEAFLAPTWSPSELSRSILRIGRSVEVGREEVESRLKEMGYRKVPLVSERGEFSARGWIFDVYPLNMDRPVRLEFFGDLVEELKTFDVGTQRSDSRIDEVEVVPAFEKGEGPPLIGAFEGCHVYYFTESAWRRVSAPDDAACPGGLDRGAPLRLPDGEPVFVLHALSMEGETRAPGLSLSGLGLLHGERGDVYGLAPALKARDDTVVLVLASESRARRIKEVLAEGGVVAPLVPLGEMGDYSGKCAVTVGPLTAGLHVPGLIILTEREIFGRRPSLRPRKASRMKDLIENLEDLKAGDYVVHREHGVGRFTGLEHLRTGDYEGEALVIEYADGARLLLPVQAIGLLQKYRAGEGAPPGLDRLGGSRWKRKKAQARKKVRELARKLISIHAQREVIKGHSFSPDTELHRDFEAFFPYEDTPDQVKAWEEIKRDMESPRPMDRLLCGDVGYGKTEVAMRAAFKAVYEGKQVAVLVPTTILCEQHYRNFQSRFSAFPVRIDFLSRFKSPSATKKTLEALSRGDVEIIIGTHGLLGRKVRFFDLGLLIVDEEHRFGVAHKERIKELKKGVDTLSMSATPIPRTLEMALSGIREMSMIETPPEERLAVKSMVTTFSDAVIEEAVERELARGGQVFFVHNRIRDIYSMADRLRRLVPRARLAIAHGRMDGGELEDVMLRFMDGAVDVLLATAIIGSGIDVPSANTIIVNRADRMGLADLYQLKGRVGRSNKQAYAYFFLPPPEKLTEDGRKRIQAIEELSYLGAGLRLAMKDLEIRGAGNLLGPEQSGHIHAVGFEMYMEMLRQEVSALKGRPLEEELEPSIDLALSAYIPEDYIGDMSLRLSMYRRLSICRSEGDVDALMEEMADRFGPLPGPAAALLSLVRLKVLARRLMVLSVSAAKGTARVRFSPETPLKAEDLLRCAASFGTEILFHEDGFTMKGKGARGGPAEELGAFFSLILASCRPRQRDP